MSVMGQKASSVHHLPWCGCGHPAGLTSRTHEAQPAATLMYGMLNSVHLHTTPTPDREWQQQGNFMQHWNMKWATWWWASHPHCRWDSTGSAVVQLRLKSSKFTSNFFLLPCQYEEEAILVLHLGFRHQSKCSLSTALAAGPATFSSSTEPLFSCKVGLYLQREDSRGDRNTHICE